MKKTLTLMLLAFLFAGVVAVAENPVAVDCIGEMPVMAEEAEAVVCEDTAWVQNVKTIQEINKLTESAWSEVPSGKNHTPPTIVTVTMDPPLRITHFDQYFVDVEIDVPEAVTLKTVTLTVTPISFMDGGIQTISWNYNVDGQPAENNPTVRVQTDTFTGSGTKTITFSRIRPDDIYPEIQFAPSSYIYFDEPKDKLIDRDNLHLMHYTNPFEIADGTSFFIELYVEPVNPNPPRPVDLQVFLVGRGKDVEFFNGDWQNDPAVAQVRAINWEDTIHHVHTPNSRHHLIPLTASKKNGTTTPTINVGDKSIDVNDNFWVVLYVDTHLDRRAWNLKYHDEPVLKTGGLRDTGHWYIKTGPETAPTVTGLPDAHVHLARNEENELVDGVRLDVQVEYLHADDTHSVDYERKYFFGQIENLPPNASSFTGPPAGIYSQTLNISWNPATDPNNDEIKYNLYLFDVGAQTDVYTIATNITTTNQDFNTLDVSSPGDGVYNIRIEACDDEFCVSFFLYDIYDIGEEFVIANDPFTWTGDTDNNWNTENNWLGNQIPSVDGLAFIPESVTRDLVIGDGINAQARRLSIADGRTVTITAGGKLEVTQSLVNEAGAANLVVEPGASLIHNTPWPSEGVPATVKNHIAGGGTSWNKNATAWYYIAAPVVDQEIQAAMDDAFDGTPGAGDFDLYRWSEAQDLWINYHSTVSPTFNRDHFLSGEGYIFGAPDPVTLSLSGKLGSGDITWENLTYSGTGSEGVYSAGWHLLGNPFPSGIVATNTWTFENIVHTPKIWQTEAGSYKDVSEGFIPANTAFFMQVDGTESHESNSLTIPFSSRAHVAPAPGKNTQQNRIRLVAKAQGSEMRQQHVIRLEPDAAEGFDPRYDSRFMAGYAPQLFSITVTDWLSTLAIPEITDDLVIPMVFHKNHEGENFLIRLEQNIPNTELYLADLKLDIEHQLKTDKPYGFVSEENDAPQRFELRFSPKQDEDPTGIAHDPGTAQGMRIWTHNRRLHVYSTEDGARVELFDINGRRQGDFVANRGEQSYALQLPAGVYVARLSGQQASTTTRLVLP